MGTLHHITLSFVALFLFPAMDQVKVQETLIPHQIQAVVNGLETTDQARLAGEVLRARKDVLTARFDPTSRNMLLRILPGSDLDRLSINALLAHLGLTVRCVHRTEAENDQLFQHLDPSTCQEATPNK